MDRQISQKDLKVTFHETISYKNICYAKYLLFEQNEFFEMMLCKVV